MLRPICSRRRKPLFILVNAGLAFVASVANGSVTNCTVTTTADDPGTASASVDASTTSGTLRDCILAANLLTGSTCIPTVPGMTITFAAGLSGATIALGNALPLLFNNTSIDASALADSITIDGGNAHRIFFVSGLPQPINYNGTGRPDPDGAQAISVTLRNLRLQHGSAKGGDSKHAGGMGAGGSLFVNKLASVTLDHVSLSGNIAQGGSVVVSTGYGGGGGMGAGTSQAGGGGLGAASVGGAGAGLGTCGTAGGASGGWGGQGLGQISNAQGFNPADFDVDSGSGASGAGLIGGGGKSFFNKGPGGFGGGGGYGGTSGGFGGGGGYAFGASRGGDGGFGGGGGDGDNSHGGFGAGSKSNGVPGVGGTTTGGAAGFGGAIFVRSGGNLTVQNAAATGAIAGGSVVAGVGSINNGAAAGSGMFLMSAATTIFDIAGSYAIGDALADDSTATLPPGQSYRVGNGPGAAITKQGAGTLVLSGPNTYGGVTTIAAGALRVAVPGTIQSSTTLIGGGGTLTGDGTTGPVDSSGTIAPGTQGNPQGTLYVIGSLTVHP